jgi:hypothetical protein
MNVKYKFTENISNLFLLVNFSKTLILKREQNCKEKEDSLAWKPTFFRGAIQKDIRTKLAYCPNWPDHETSTKLGCISEMFLFF